MRILLVAPGEESSWPGWIRTPQLSLFILEALSPKGHQVVTVEEDFAPIPLEEKWDLVGITVMTAKAPRAYALASAFRKRGAKVVLGGIHPSVLPEEANQYADAVLVGEAEGFWPGILEDAAQDRLKPIYYNHLPKTLRLPLIDYKRSNNSQGPAITPVVSSRGCPNRCEFCSVPRIYGERVRKVPLEQVLEQVKNSHSKYVAFLDDNLTADRDYALALFEGLRALKVSFLGQATVRFILDDGLFQAAVAAGLKAILVGFETVGEEGRKRLKKSVSLAACCEAIRKCRASRVLLHGSFVFGLDEDDKTIFNRTADFIMKNQIFSVSATILTPYPGTPLFDRMVAEGRLLHQNWSFYDIRTPVFLPKRMTLEDLVKGYVKFRESVHSLWSIARRLPAGLSVNPSAYIHMNAAMRRSSFSLRDHYKNYFNYLATACPDLQRPHI